jgi:hypothetical protein
VNDLPRTAALVDTQFLAVPLALNETSIRSGHFRLKPHPSANENGQHQKNMK